jgi:hypothetical protein
MEWSSHPRVNNEMMEIPITEMAVRLLAKSNLDTLALMLPANVTFEEME